MENFVENVLYAGNDVTGLLEVTLEAEIAWNGIEKTLMKDEFKAVVNESTEDVQGSKKSMFKSVIEFFKKLWASFVNAMKNLNARFTAATTNGSKFVENNKALLNAFRGDGKSVNVSVANWNDVSVGKHPAAGKITPLVTGSKSTQALSVDGVIKAIGYDSGAELDKAITSFWKSGESAEKEVKSSDVAKSMSRVQNFKSVVAGLKEYAKNQKLVIDAGTKQANAGLSASDDTSAKVAAAAVTTAKSCASVVSRVMNKEVSLAVARFSDDMKVLRAALSNSPKQKGKSDVKEESANLLGLTLEDFGDEEAETLEEEVNAIFE